MLRSVRESTDRFAVIPYRAHITLVGADRAARASAMRVTPSRAGICLPLCVLANGIFGVRSVRCKLVNRLKQAIRCFCSPERKLMKSIFDIVVRLPFLGLR
ncbi:MAG: hypothetical protein ACI83N_002316 [Hydrogenophaga sp.]|jgi:hypothetical protein